VSASRNFRYRKKGVVHQPFTSSPLGAHDSTAFDVGRSDAAPRRGVHDIVSKGRPTVRVTHDQRIAGASRPGSQALAERCGAVVGWLPDAPSPL
jgi:hypothetical protein